MLAISCKGFMLPSSAVVKTCDERDVCMPGVEVTAARFLLTGVHAVESFAERSPATLSTDPSQDTSISNNSSCSIVGKRDSSIASLVSVESSQGSSESCLVSSLRLESRGRFLDMKASMFQIHSFEGLKSHEWGLGMFEVIDKPGMKCLSAHDCCGSNQSDYGFIDAGPWNETISFSPFSTNTRVCPTYGVDITLKIMLTVAC